MQKCGRADVVPRGLIAVTGASGHTGYRLVGDLVAKGETVRAVTRDPAVLPLELRRKVEICRADLTREDEAREAVRGAAAVLALTHIRHAPLIIAAMKAEGIQRVVFTSSTRRFTRFPEETARAVIAGEDAVRASGLDWTILRPSMIYGGYHDNNLVHLVHWLRRFPVHPLPGGGRMLWQPVFTWDVIAAIEAAMERPETAGKEYTLAGPEPVSYRQMVMTILRLLKRRCLLVPVPISLLRFAARIAESVSARPRIRMDQIRRLEEDKVFDITEARRDLGFSPRSFEEGIRRKLSGTA
jgi:uncharacterized protein YbjT (DUF2867 family)